MQLSNIGNVFIFFYLGAASLRRVHISFIDHQCLYLSSRTHCFNLVEPEDAEPSGLLNSHFVRTEVRFNNCTICDFSHNQAFIHLAL